jgi:hypothetical protein
LHKDPYFSKVRDRLKEFLESRGFTVKSATVVKVEEVSDAEEVPARSNRNRSLVDRHLIP